MNKINKHYRTISKALRASKYPDPYFCSKYTFSPYMACEHGCVYCDGRAERYYVEGNYDEDIVIKRNIPELLEAEIPKLKEKAPVIVGSGISDPYQPVENEEQLIRKSALILAKNNFPAAVMTKSALILRDLEIWYKVAQRSNFVLLISLTFTDDDLRKIFEPKTAPVQERFDIMRKFKQKGMHVGVMAMPFLPFINDKEDKIDKLFAKLKNIGVDFVLPASLTLRPGRQKQFYLNTIESEFPHLLESYQKLYANELSSGSPVYKYRNKFYKLVSKIQANYEIPQEIPHYVYKNSFPIYDEIFILLQHMQNLYKRANIDISNLKHAANRYKKWLLDWKNYLIRKKSINQRIIETEFLKYVKSSHLNRIINNKKLADFIKQVVLAGKIFDYQNLKLTESNPA